MKIFKKALKWGGIVVVALIIIGATLYAIYVRPFLKHMAQTKLIQYDKNLTVELGGGGNSGILASDSLVIVIDTKQDKASEAFADLAKHIAGNKPILVINTHYHRDHTGGNHLYQGQQILAGGYYTKEAWVKEAGDDGIPTRWLKDSLNIKMGDELVTILNCQNPAHTESDVVVYLHKRQLLFSGDIILNKQIPALVTARATPYGYLEAMDMLQKRFAIKTIIPGHGEMGGIEILNAFTQYFLDMQTASKDDDKKDQLIAKYKDWLQIPMVMSPGATIKLFKYEAGK